MEFKDFENKINDITDKFMSLLETDDVIGYSSEKQNDNIVDFSNEKQNDNIVDFSNEKQNNNIVDFSNEKQNDNIIDFSKIVNDISPSNNFSSFKLSIDDTSFGKVNLKDNKYGNIIMFDTIEQAELNNKLDGLYKEKNNSYNKKMSIAFSDTKFENNKSNYSVNEEYTKDKINNKGVEEMAIYNGNQGEEKEIFSFATIPAEKALVEKRSFADTLFMDIPWDTKIDIWGGFKQFCRTQVKITF